MASPASPRFSTSLSRIAWAIDLAFAHVRQQRDLASPFDGEGQLALVAAGEPGDPAGADLAAVGDEALERVQVLVVDVVDVDPRVLARAEAVARAAAPRRAAARSV